MAGSFSYQFRALMLDNGVGQQPFTPPPILWVALYVAPPGPSDLGQEAVMDAGRIQFPNDLTTFAAAVNGVKNSVAVINVPAQTTELGTITSVGWRDSQTGGMLCFSCDLDTPIPMIIGSSINWPKGSFAINWA